MEEEEERVHFEEEEVTTIRRKTIRTQSTTRRKKHSDAKSSAGKTEFKLSPFIHGAKNRDAYTPGTPEVARKPDRVQKLVQDTLNEYKGSELPQKCSNRIFLGAFDSDTEEDDGIEDITVDNNKTRISKLRVWSFQKCGRPGLDRFRRIVDFVILAQNVFTCRRTVALNRRDSILFFLDRQGTADFGGGESEPKFDLSAFKSLGQKTKMASVKTCLEIPPSERTDGQINHMMHTMRAFKRFSNYPQAIQTGLCKNGWYAKFEASKVIVKEGNKADFYYLILSGIAVYRDISMNVDEMHNTRNELVASYLKPGDTLGEKEILTNSERPATVVCKEPVEVLGVDREALIDIFKAAGGLGSIEFLKCIPELSDFPLELLQTYHFSMAVHYYRRGAVIAKNGNESEWIYIVRSGSCQVYKAIKDNYKKERYMQPASRPASSNKKLHRESTGLLFPSIHKHRNDILKSSSTMEINELSEKNHRKKKAPTLERSHTMLPSLNPGKTSLVHSSSTTDTNRLNTPVLHEVHREGSKENTSPNPKKKFSQGSPKASRKKHSPDILRLSRASSTLCETPDAVRNTRQSHLRSPSLESINQSKFHKKNSSSSGESIFDSSRSSNNSEYDTQKQLPSWQENGSPVDTTGSMFYVRLGNVTEKGVFGLHPLVYDDMPNLSLVSNGAECVLISKQFLKDQMTTIIAHRLRNKLPQYPSSGQLRSALDDQINWESYREKVVSAVLK
ncbi:uncharacterized protein LOC128559244 [Mercenaria mercenaria]|uniref:uncharacterized protein LOC128559244 n=1 Tax=Mercenaria mercenaria TaxID=6596 RepID=UPI00234EC62E|nr:uncharacterized protein LOC128559244 [Mercenaria mercenaria]